jgi:hypothetical protein
MNVMKTTPFLIVLMLISSSAFADGWKDDAIWHDGLVEKAVYAASRVIYGKPRPYEAIFLTNKEQHDHATLTKADKSKDTIEVWKHNQIEDIPTPNYTYHYVTTSHLTTNELALTRLDCGEMEWCGTSFKQYLDIPQISSNQISYLAFSYMPEAGRIETAVWYKRFVVATDSLPLYLRNFEFKPGNQFQFDLLPSQKSNRPTEYKVQDGALRFAGEDGDAWKIELLISGKLAGTYWMAKNRLHVMTRYESADGTQKYELKSVDRVNYWTIRSEK